MNEPDGIPNHVIEVLQVHGLARFIEAERTSNRQTGAAWRNLLVRTLRVFKVMRDDIDQFKFERLPASSLTDNCRTFAAFLSGAVNGQSRRIIGPLPVPQHPHLSREAGSFNHPKRSSEQPDGIGAAG